ncbi:hypothetical protein N7486_002273 [Penicillium sp. IBT 16267x]|nr:hypothetical protein N7486_002273 [Penicillium sp. IBT 16267x]
MAGGEDRERYFRWSRNFLQHISYGTRCRGTMSRFNKGKRLPGAEFTWDADPGGVPDTAPTPLYPVRFPQSLRF